MSHRTPFAARWGSMKSWCKGRFWSKRVGSKAIFTACLHTMPALLFHYHLLLNKMMDRASMFQQSIQRVLKQFTAGAGFIQGWETFLNTLSETCSRIVQRCDVRAWQTVHFYIQLYTRKPPINSVVESMHQSNCWQGVQNLQVPAHPELRAEAKPQSSGHHRFYNISSCREVLPEENRLKKGSKSLPNNVFPRAFHEKWETSRLNALGLVWPTYILLLLMDADVEADIAASQWTKVALWNSVFALSKSGCVVWRRWWDTVLVQRIDGRDLERRTGRLERSTDAPATTFESSRQWWGIGGPLARRCIFVKTTGASNYFAEIQGLKLATLRTQNR